MLVHFFYWLLTQLGYSKSTKIQQFLEKYFYIFKYYIFYSVIVVSTVVKKPLSVALIIYIRHK